MGGCSRVRGSVWNTGRLVATELHYFAQGINTARDTAIGLQSRVEAALAARGI